MPFPAGAASPVAFDLGLASAVAGDGDAPSRAALAASYRIDEPTAVAALLPDARLEPDMLARAQELATRLAVAVRAGRARAGGVDALMLEFSLDSDEGIALMCLAEALLRIPDAPTRDRLIRDKLGRGQWRGHVGASPSLFVNAAAWGLLVSGHLVASHSDRRLESALASLLRKGGEPLIRRGVDLAMRLLGRQFVTGRTIEEALANAREREARGYTFSFDMLGEAAVTAHDAARYFHDYEAAVHAIGRASAGRGVHAGPGLSVKLSALHPRYSRNQRARVHRELTPRVIALARLAARYDIGMSIDAEEADRLELSLDVLTALVREPALASWQGLGFVVQAYQKRALPVLEWLIALARGARRRLNVRLVKGAYWDAEIKRAQQDGVADYPVFTRKSHTDVAYLACVRTLLGAPEAVYPQFATHNAFTIAAVHALAGGAEYEFQCLHGMGETLYDLVIGPGGLERRCRIYAPVGSHETLLAYLVRRLLENGANTSFVNRIVDPAVPIAELVADPVTIAERTGGAPHPRIPLPAAMLGDRRNAMGLDFSDDQALAALDRALAATPVRFEATTILADSHGAGRRTTEQHALERRQRIEICNPAQSGDVVGVVAEATAEDVAHAIALAVERGAAWAATTVEARAQALERAADLFEAERPRLLALLVREAGRTLPDAVGEVREAVDFCRYYALQARAELSGVAVSTRGPIVCISPWNFPLSIFVGQVAAALAAGNGVLAKPAEQTPLVAAAAVALFHRAGIPASALQLLPGTGEIGAALVGDPRIAGVLFTGSTGVAHAIHRELATRNDEPVLIAETGGQNAMIVDSSALPEQVIGDVLLSAFDSAGQRCSALRVLCVQEDVADTLLAMLEGAMREMTMGDPRCLATDIGPVIDPAARDALEAHIARLRDAGCRVFQAARPGTGAGDAAMEIAGERSGIADNGDVGAIISSGERFATGCFLPPTLVELGGIEGFAHLREEVFGPVLHVIRWPRTALPALIAAINATGYALTHGIHSRIDETIAFILEHIRAGNVYVNRNMIGAVVGVQPFGGHGRSGTGPKAGGPLYLRRLVRTRLPMRFPDDMRMALAGATGESNVLEFRPRGLVACLADDPDVLAAQGRAAQALGNAVVMLRGPTDVDIDAGIGIGHGLDATRLRLVDAIDFAGVDAVLVDLAPERTAAIRAECARVEGRIIPVIAPDSDGNYDSTRLIVERTVTINTAAAGGNAALLAMAGDEK